MTATNSFSRAFHRLRGSKPGDARLRRFFTDLPAVEASGKRVLQYVGISAMYLTPTEILMYHLLRQQGVHVDYLVYDESIPINEIITKEVEDGQGKERFWRNSCRRGRRQLDAAGVQYQTISVDAQAEEIVRELPSTDSILQFTLDGIGFGKIIQGALFRYFKSITPGENAEEVSRRMLVTALSNYFCIAKHCDDNQYDAVLFSHGIYVTWEPVVEYCRRAGINFVCYDRAKTKEHANFNMNQPSPDWSMDAAWQRYSNRELAPQEKDQVAEYLKDRELQQGDVFAYNFSARAEDLAQEKQRLGIPVGRKCVTIFTNLIWDAANVSRDVAFDSALDCVLQTIEHCRGRDDVQVIVRAHPAEKVLGTDERYCTLVESRFGDNLPENVTLISPEDDVNSFAVIDMSDVGVVNTSTVGLEMALDGKPVLLIAQTHYRGKGFTHDVQSVSGYFTTLDAQLRKATQLPEQVALAEKYFYLMMFRYQQKLPVRYTDDHQFDGYSVDHFSQLSKDEPLVRIVRRIVDGPPQDFVDWD